MICGGLSLAATRATLGGLQEQALGRCANENPWRNWGERRYEFYWLSRARGVAMAVFDRFVMGLKASHDGVAQSVFVP